MILFQISRWLQWRLKNGHLCSMLVFPNAKINLGLQVLHKRSDGYHDIITAMLPLPALCDALELVECEGSDQLSLTGLPVPGDANNNLCIKALQLLRNSFEIPPQHIHLHKVIPMGAGLGGGSADAAFLLKAMNEKYSLKINDKSLAELAASLGSDCAFFIANRPAMARGRGELLSEFQIDLSEYQLFLLHPNFHISTAEAYAHVPLRPDEDQSLDLLSKGPEAWRGHLSNAFEEYAFRQKPELRSLRDELYRAGALYASMTGSGSAIYGIFAKEQDPGQAFEGLHRSMQARNYFSRSMSL